MSFITDWFAILLNSEGSLFLEILLSYLGGILASLNPCNYPLLPLTFSILMENQIEHRLWKRSLVWYLSGATLTYATLGLFAVSTGKLFGSWTHSPGVLLGLGVFIQSMGLWSLEVLSFDVFLSQLQHFLKPSHGPLPPTRRTSFLRPFLLGLSSGLLSTPCSTPLLGTVLAYTAITQSFFKGFLLLSAFSLGLNSLLVLLSFLGHQGISLPRSGPWMMGFKKLSGFLLVAFGAYLFYLAGKAS